MKQLILTLALFVYAFVGFSQEKGTTQLSALNVSSTDVAINVSSPAVTHYFFDNIGITLGVANYGWGDHVQIEPRLNFTDVISEDRNLSLSVHLNLVF